LEKDLKEIIKSIDFLAKYLKEFEKPLNR